jgi:pyrimidine oxygenase
MGVWPGNQYYGYRYDYAEEYVRVLRELWEAGRSDFKGKHFQMDDCRLLPTPSRHIPVVCAGQSDVGMALCAKYGDVQFVLGNGVNNPAGHAETNQRLLQAAAAHGRDDLGSYILTMVIADETDEAAFAKWRHYQAGADAEALGWMSDQFAADKTGATGSNKQIATLPDGAVNLNMLTIVGSYANVARLLDEAGEVPGTKGLLLTFDDFLIGMEQFGQRIQPLMRSRAGRSQAAA